MIASEALASASIPLYSVGGEFQCSLPPHLKVKILEQYSEFTNYVKVHIPSPYAAQCGSVGLVKREEPEEQSEEQDEVSEQEVLEAPEDWEEWRTPRRQHRQRQRMHTTREEEVEELYPARKRTRKSVESVSDEYGNEVSETEGSYVGRCLDCERGRDANAGIEDWGQQVQRRTMRPQCEAPGYQPSVVGRMSRQSLGRAIRSYSERAQGAIRRSYLALVPPPGTANYERVRRLTNNFQDFDSVDPTVLKGLIRRSTGHCYQFVKAALSNDYSVLAHDNQSRSDRRKNPLRRANVKLVAESCGQNRGDLVQNHWQNSAVGAGTAGPQLEKRGFINLMDPKWGVSQRFKNDYAAPEGAVLVYKCGRGGRVVTSSKCYGDIAIRTKTGFIRDFFSPHSITARGTRVLVGIYIKPDQEDL